ncbi:MAG: DNA-3-methyladenine glycosylase I [Nevskiales bacterium]
MNAAPLSRCPWAEHYSGAAAENYLVYHDQEWGVPAHGERHLFEMLILEGAQAGLSWSTILNKRPNYRRAFDGFDAEKVARYAEAKIEKLLADPGIVRNRLKINAAVSNARAVLELREEFGSLDAYLWRYVEGSPIQNHWRSLKQVPAKTALSDQISKDLQQRGFKFVGSTIIYAFMQAVGMVNDHVVGCYRHQQVAPLR